MTTMEGTTATLEHEPPAPPVVAEAGRAVYLDVARAAAICAVIVIHVSSAVLSHASGKAWWVANIYDTGSTWAVPLFIMISGALLLKPSRVESPAQFYRRRFSRIAAPIVFWSIFYLCWRKWFEYEHLSLRAAVRELVLGRPYVHIYFLFLIAGLYLITPLLRAFVKSEPASRQVAAAFIALAWTASRSFFEAAFHLRNDPVFLSMFTSCIGYYLMGHVVAAGYLPRAWYRWSAAIILLAGATAVIGSGVVLHIPRVSHFQLLVGGFAGPVIMLMSIGVFSWFVSRSAQIRRWPFLGAIQWISAMSFGVYLCHPVVMGLMLKMHVSFMRPNAWAGIALWSAAILVVSLVVTQIAQKIPWVRAVFG